MAESVIDGLQVVDVGVDHRQGRPRPAFVLEPLLGQQREAAAVVEAGHVVAQRHRPQLVFDGAVLGDVGGGDDDVAQCPVAVAQRRQRAGHQQPLPVTRHPVTLERVGDRALAEAPQTVAERRGAFADEERLGELVSAQLLVGVTGRDLHGAIGLLDTSGAVEHEDEGVGGLEHGSEQIALRL